MSTEADDTTVVRIAVEVEAAPGHAFGVFTGGINSWWIRSHHLLNGELKEVGIDPVVGGRMWEENDVGEICEWGQVLTWSPPRQFSFSWRIGTDWGVPAADAPASRVTVTFTPTESGTTIVELVHDQLDSHGDGWESMRDSVGGDGGWPAGLRQFAAAI